MGREYLASLWQCLMLMLPPGVLGRADVQIELLKEEIEDGDAKTEAQEQLLTVLDAKGPLRGGQLNRLLPRLHMRRRPRMLVLVFAVLALHSLEIVLFAFGYMLLPDLPGHGALVSHSPLGFVDYGYFSAVAYTTLGLGDIVPVGPIRILAGAQSLLGFVLIILLRPLQGDGN